MSTIYSKDSFDRFGDDLNGLILSYLPLEDRIKFESVSHQWKRTVYQRVKHLVFESKDDLLTKKLFSKKQMNDKLSAFDSLLTKCHNITNLSFGSEFEFFEIIARIPGLNAIFFKVIAKYCSHLRSIDNSSYALSQELAQTFYQTIGHKIQSIVLYENQMKFAIIGNRFVNLRQLDIKCRPDYDWRQVFDVSDETHFPIKRLTHLRIAFNENVKNYFKTIVANNKRLKCLDLTIHSSKSKTTQSLIKELSTLTELKSLRLQFISSILSQRVLKSFQMIVKKCHKFEMLVIVSEIGNRSPIQSFINLATCLPKLLHLDLIFTKDITFEMSCQSLAKCPNLQHLGLTVPKIKNSLFEDIQKYLPKLRQLSIHECNQNEEIFDNIERNLDLQILDEIMSAGYQRVPYIKKLFNNCDRLKSFQLKSKNYSEHFTRTYSGGIRFSKSIPNWFSIKLMLKNI